MDYVGEIMVGLVLLAFAGAFAHWSNTIKQSFQQVMERLDALVTEFHEHAVKTERRVTRVETKIDMLHETEGRIESAVCDNMGADEK